MRDPQRNVLIFAHECVPHNRPESTIGAQRPAQFAKHLPEFGWRAVVLCCDRDNRRVAVDNAALRSRVKHSLTGVAPDQSIIIPTPSLPHDGWIDKAWHACNAGTGLMRAVRKTLTIAKLATGDYSQSWQPCAWTAAEVVQAEWPMHACIGEHTPDAGLFLGSRFAKKYLVPWIADFRDPILYPFRPLARRLYRPIARRIVRSAFGTVNVNDVLTELDHQMFGLPAWTIPNGFDPSEYALSPSKARRSEEFVVAYSGSVHQMQRMDVFVEGLSLLSLSLPPEDLNSFRFVYRGDSKKVGKLVEHYGVRAIADLHERVDRHALFDLLSNADILLLLSAADCPPEDAEFFGKGFHPGKTFEYFGLRKPILCVPGDGGLLNQLIQETETGVIAPTPQAVADSLIKAFREWKSGAPRNYRPNEAALSRYTRRSQAERLAAILDQATATTMKSNKSHCGFSNKSGRS